MNEDQQRILQMVADGTVTAEEGASLLDAVGLATTPSQPAPEFSPDLQRVSQGRNSNGPMQGRYLVIRIEEGHESKVNVRIPLGLARAAARFIPRQAQEHLDNYDIDLQQLVSDLGSGIGTGPLIEVVDSEDSVRISVE